MFSTTREFKDLYLILAINENATPDEIKKAYRAKALTDHPDKNPSPDAGEKFEAIQEAYEILSDEDKRAVYDKERAAYLSGQHAAPPKLFDISDLVDLVKNHKLTEIAEIIKKEKVTRGWRWSYSDKYEIQSAFRDAILLGQIDTIKFFLSQDLGASGSAPLGNSNSHMSYIHFAATTGKLEIVKMLVEAGADIAPHNSYYSKGDDSAIEAAIKGGHVPIVDYLLSKGAQARGVFGGYRRDTFIAYAAKKDYTQIVELLTRYGAGHDIEASFSLAKEKYVERIQKLEYQLKSHYQEEDRQKIIADIASATDFMRFIYESSLKTFDEKKPLIEKKLAKLNSYYKNIIKNLMDHAVGIDLNRGLKFLHSLKTVAGINFMGVSVGGIPVTEEMLQAEKLNGVSKAIITFKDLDNIENPLRRDALQKRCSDAIKKCGTLIINDTINLVPLWRAAEIGDMKAVNTRLAAGIDPNEMSDSDESPIVLATKNKHEQIVLLLCNHPKFDVKTLSAAIQTAQDTKNPALAEKLKEMQDVNQLDAKGDALLHHAIRNGNVDEVIKLIHKGADVNLKGSQGYPLYMAANKSYDRRWEYKPSKKHIEIIKILLDHKADPNLCFYNQTAMDVAGCAGSAEALAILIPLTEKKPIIKNDKSYPWYTEIMFESHQSKEWTEILMLLKANGADLNQTSVYGDDTLLHLVFRLFPSLSSVYSVMRDLNRSVAGYDYSMVSDRLSNAERDLIHDSQREFFKHIKLIDFLLDHEINPNISNRNGTALHDLLRKIDLDHIVGGYAKVIDKFLAKGFVIDAIDDEWRTLLHITASHGRLNAVKYLLARGFDVNAIDKHGRTPLHYAHAHPDVIQHLLQHHADPTIKDKDGLTPVLYSEAQCKDWMNTESSKSWERKSQQDWLAPYRISQWKLRSYVPEFEEKIESSVQYTNKTQLYIDRFKLKTETNHSILANYPLEIEDKALLENYYDDVSHQMMDVPVVLHERVYDLKTLLSILEKDKKDPFTGVEFNLSDILPAMEVALEIEDVMCFFKEKYKHIVENKPTTFQASNQLDCVLAESKSVDNVQCVSQNIEPKMDTTESITSHEDPNRLFSQKRKSIDLQTCEVKKNPTGPTCVIL